MTIKVRKTLAAFAWRYNEDAAQSGDRSLCCDYCGRNVSLNRFSTISSRYMRLDQQNNSNNNNESAFNPYEEHKYFCKWSSAQIQTIDDNQNELESDPNHGENNLTQKNGELQQMKKNENNNKQEKYDRNVQSINGWNICINYLLDSFTFSNKKKKTFETVSEIHKMQDEIKKLQTNFKDFESSISQKYDLIAKECESINLNQTEGGESHSNFKQKLLQNRQSIDDILKDLNLNSLLSDPTKKVKTN